MLRTVLELLVLNLTDIESLRNVLYELLLYFSH